MAVRTHPAPQHRAEAVAPDKGCAAWPKCTTCIFSTCIAELSNGERNELHAALRLVRRYLALDTVIPT